MKRFQEQIMAMLLIFAITMFGTMIILAIKDETGISPIEIEKTEEPQLHAFNIKITCEYTPPDPTYVFMCAENKEIAHERLEGLVDIREEMKTVTLPTVEMKLTDLGKYYITGYTSWELGGSTATASGATCHKAASYQDSFYNPTTCAIDPVIHDFGDIFYIEEFGCFIAEDTGSAVKQKHLDLYYGTTYEDNQEALPITGYYTVYQVEFIYGEVPAMNYDIQSQVADLVIGWKLTDEMKGVETEEVQKGPYYE